jgi:hypothetical protein
MSTPNELSQAVIWERSYSRNFPLRPLQISLHLLGGLHPILEVGAGGLETALCAGLQFEQFAVFGV